MMKDFGLGKHLVGGGNPKRQIALLEKNENRYFFNPMGSLCIEGNKNGMACTEILFSEDGNFIVILNEAGIVAVAERLAAD